MRLRLPQIFRRSHDLPLGPGVSDPGPAFRIIDPPDEVESVEVVGTSAETHATERSDSSAPRPAPPPPLEAGYRWGMAAARARCDLATPAEYPEVVHRDTLPAPRMERAVLALATRTEVLSSAIERIEDRLAELSDHFIDVVTHEELIEIESRRARLSAEVSRLSVELKAEMDRRISELGRVVAEANRRAANVDQRGPLDIADARRIELHLDRLAEGDPITHLSEAG